MDLHHLIRTEKRPSLLQLSKISKSESRLPANKFNYSNNRKPISLSLQNPKSGNKIENKNLKKMKNAKKNIKSY